MALTGNKGEWSEIYTLFKLLGDKKVYAGDENLNKIEHLFYPILKVLRDEQNQHYEYSVNDELIIVTENGEELLKKPIGEFIDRAKSLFSTIRQSNGTFAIPEIEQFMSEIGCKQLKAKSTDKTDIRVVIHDLNTGMTPQLGFSIKSQLGANSTLINAGPTTNIVYRIKGLEMSDIEMQKINSMNKNNKMDLIGRIRYIYSKNLKLEFFKYQNDILEKNLMMIDTALPVIINKMLLNFYLTESRTVIELIRDVEKENFLNFDIENYPYFYKRKVANMLVDSALGMMPKKVWHGKYETTGGYLIVKEDGEVLCYHFYNRNLFENYLLYNTAFETPGKHEKNNFGIVYKIGDDYFINLELQVRFLK